MNVVVPTVRPRFVVYAHVFLRMPTNCPYANGSFTVRNAYFFCVNSTLTDRQGTKSERFVCPQYDHGSLPQ